MKKIKFFLLSLFLSVNMVFADIVGNNGDSSWRVGNPGFQGDLKTTLHTIISALIQISIPFLVLGFVYIGFLFVKAEGNPEELAKVRKYFLWAIVGALIIFGADLILSMIEDSVKKIKI